MSFKQFLNKLEFLSKRLNSRYNECGGSQGHKEPDIKKNYCNYCHKHLIFKTESQKYYDFFKGLSILEQEDMNEVKSKKEHLWYRKPDIAPCVNQNKQKTIIELEKNSPKYKTPDITPGINQYKKNLLGKISGI